ncbi:MAG: hypothetical protein WC729_23865 [Sphingomonas sp.]|uniref:glycine-rich domain-containing protein n=1 Tax=Sphingomonas sp. TaxID=28214 RepID=UPI0035678D93
MSKTNRLPTTCPDHPVWASLFPYSIGPEDAALSFVARLARENGWSLGYAERVIGEYKKFCFLAVTGETEVTPSDAVDQAWHLHLTYSRDYWERFCPEVLGRPLHHGPTAGGAGERGRFFDQYAETLKRYERVFGDAPPPDIWPGGARRLIDDPKARRVHPRDAFIIPRRTALLSLLTILLAAAAVLALVVSR